jgi:RimJ/RimL family protein N-acetyltransferase
MTAEQIRVRYEKNFYDEEFMVKKRASRMNLTFRELKIYYSEKGFHVDDSVGKGYGKQILNALCDEARNQGAKEFHCSCREKNLASRGLQDACGFKFDYRSEEKTDPRTGEIYVVVNAKKDLQYVV